jgi:putative oxidoreductase
MKIAVIIARVILGLVYFGFSLAFFFNLMPHQELSGNAGTFVVGLGASGYVMPLVKAIELVCGVAFLLNRFVPLATVVIFPITLNIVLFHVFMAPEGMILPVVLLFANLFLAYVHHNKYTSLLAAR